MARERGGEGAGLRWLAASSAGPASAGSKAFCLPEDLAEAEDDQKQDERADERRDRHLKPALPRAWWNPTVVMPLRLTRLASRVSIHGPEGWPAAGSAGFRFSPAAPSHSTSAAAGMMAAKADQIRVVILDLDGVIYRGHTAIPGAAETAQWLRDRDYQTYFFTNNSTRTRDSYVELLRGYGLETDPDHIVTSASLTVRYFVDNELIPANVLIVGEGGLADELRGAGLRVFRRPGKQKIDYVVVGMDRRFTYHKLHLAQQAIRAGAEFIATNRDATYPVEGNVIPGGGSVVAAVATAAEREPILIGKPAARAGELIVHQAGVAPEEALMVGDRLETDIEMGRRAGLLTCLVLTGISTAEEARALSPRHRPHWIIPTIATLPDLLRSKLEGEPL